MPSHTPPGIVQLWLSFEYLGRASCQGALWEFGDQGADHPDRRNQATADIRPCRPRRLARNRARQGERASHRFIEFFTATIRNRNTRAAYARAVKQFFDWCEVHRLQLHEIEAITVAAYVEQLGGRASKPTVKQHLAAIRQLFDYLTTGAILRSIRRLRCAGRSMW